jgi:glyoxylase-like metal-dependent hydrolase (beta-lactamase superfamily II)
MTTLRACAAAAALFAAIVASSRSGIAVVAAADGPLDRAAAALGVDAVQSLTFEASGRYYQWGQAPAPELPWPAFDVSGYVADLDYGRSAVRARYRRVQVQEPGRARPHTDQTQDQYAVDGHSWNATATGPTALPANLAERNAELWTSPQGFVKAARANGGVVKPARGGHATVTFTLDRVYRYEGLIDAAGDVLRVRTILDSPVSGDTPAEWRYSEYRDFGGVRFPARIERVIAGQPWYDLRVSAVRVNAATAFAVPPAIVAAPAPVVTAVGTTELAPGVTFVTGTTHNSVVIDQAGGLVVIEAPLTEQRSDAVLAKIRELFPGRRIAGVVNTHIHFDHAGGLRTYVAAGVPVITHARNAAYLRRAWAAPRTIAPDRLAASKRAARFTTFTTKLVLPDPRNPIEIHAIAGSGHNDAFAMVFLPKAGILVEGDAWNPAAARPATPSPLWINLHENIERLKLPVQRIAPLHGAVQTIDDLRAAIAPR